MMAHEEVCSVKSSEFGDAYKPVALDYDDLGDDCQYLVLRAADPVKFKIKSASKNKGTLNSLKDLEKEKKKLIKALMKKPQATDQENVEVIDLTLDSDEENETLPLASQNQTQLVEIPETQKSDEVLTPEKQISVEQIELESPLEKKMHKRLDVSHLIEESDVTDRTCKHCKEYRRKKRKRIQRKESDMDSSDSYFSKYRRERRDRIRNATKENNFSKVKSRRRYESPARYSHKESSLKAFHDVEEAFGDFRCRLCNIEVHSEVTLRTHLAGRKHLKTLKAQAIPEIARQSLEQYSSSKPPSSSSFDQDGNQLLHYPPPAPGMTRVKVNKISKLQTVAESYRKQPVTGLNYVTEIRLPEEVVYYCELCDSTCAPNSIMCHLIGSKHKLNFLRLKYPIMYERIQYKPKRLIESEVMKILFDYDRTHGRNLIKVEEEVEELRVRRRRKRSFSPHRRNCGCTSCIEVEAVGCNNKKRNLSDSLVTDDLDMSTNDFRCRVCDSHMNNEQMWEAHIRGRRHLKNKKKGPSEKPSKIKNIFCPGERPKLMTDLLEIREPIVGLNYVQEIQGRAGNQYKCFLCGACCTSFDVIEHIISEKHRMRLLEAEHKKGNENGIEIILKVCLGMSISAREKLVAEEAAKFEREYGKGRMAVYKSKDIFPAFN